MQESRRLEADDSQGGGAKQVSHHWFWIGKLMIVSLAVVVVAIISLGLARKTAPPSSIVHAIVRASEPQPCPKRILVGSYVYELVAGDPGKAQDGKPLTASINYDSEVIIVDPDRPRDVKTESIVHELEHAAAFETIGRTADYFKHHKYRDDQWIEATAPILSRTLKEYPELLNCELK
jgi:hypothetical protein